MKVEYYAYVISGKHEIEVRLFAKTEAGAKREARKVFMNFLLSPYRTIYLCEVAPGYVNRIAYLADLTGKWRKNYES